MSARDYAAVYAIDRIRDAIYSDVEPDVAVLAEDLENTFGLDPADATRAVNDAIAACAPDWQTKAGSR